ncbi:MAG: hypothetical protein HPY54_02455 [Chthonomonadetes bacterium]|nr:hypothetical protein [Chthonomonadetes bacterium]
MNPDEMTVRPVVYGTSVRPVHRESPPRDSTSRQPSHRQENTQPEEPNEPPEEVPQDGGQTHLIDLRV